MTLGAATKFFAVARAGLLGPTLDDGEVRGCNAIVAAFEGHPVGDVAYALATAYLETAHTMQPVKEANWLSEKAANRYFFRQYDIEGLRPAKARELGNIHPGDGVKFPGRGYPQVTGRNNYQKAQDIFGVPFVEQPELMMVSENAAKVMEHFMEHGLFTGKKLADYIPRTGTATRAQFVPARRIINGTDRAGDVADYAVAFQSYLLQGEYHA
jgi:putative chitinase